MGNFINTVNSFIRKLIYRDMYTVECSIKESRESISRLEIITEEMILRDDEIRSHEILLSIATDNLDSPIWGKNLEGDFVFMNIACADKILKTTVEDAMAPKGDDYIPNLLEDVCFKSDMLVVETKKTHRFFEHARFEDGSDMWLDTTKSPWVSGSELIGTVGFGADVTKYISKEVRDKYFKSGYVEISVDLLYNNDDIPKLMECNDTNE